MNDDETGALGEEEIAARARDLAKKADISDAAGLQHPHNFRKQSGDLYAMIWHHRADELEKNKKKKK